MDLVGKKEFIVTSEVSILEKILEIRNAIKEEYRSDDKRPWIVGFSGGKDSTLVLHVLVEALLEIPWSERTRPVHVVANDTLVESPIVESYVSKTLDELRRSLADLQLPITVEATSPGEDQTFWVNLLGRGYPPPTRFFRWCTDRMKIRPTTDYIRREVSESGEVVLLLGVRRLESTARAKTAKKYDNGGRLNRHNDILGCFVYRPILELTTDEVWEYLSSCPPPWGGNHRDLLKLYRDALGGECPIVIDPDAAPSCGSSSIRFGCWTCTVVEKDRSFRNQMENGFEHLIPMAEFRDWMKDYCYRDENRFKRRRNGQEGMGPLTFEAREHVLAKLLELQSQVGISLVSMAEIAQIKEIWNKDRSQMLLQQTNRLLSMLGE